MSTDMEKKIYSHPSFFLVKDAHVVKFKQTHTYDILSLPTGPTWSLYQYRLNACDVNKQRVVIRTNTDANVCVCVYLNIKHTICNKTA